MPPPILTLTTDFGWDGPYVAAMKGVVLGLLPEARIVDVSHAVAPQNIREGAFVLSTVIDSFPTGTVHLAVVDPGVGTDRRLIAVKYRGHWFVLPDNGLIAGVLMGRTPDVVREITNPAIRRVQVSATFHGRDILAPAAAFLLGGGDDAELGLARQSVVDLPNFVAIPKHDGFLGEVLFRDPFGNLITSIRGEQVEGRPKSWRFEVAGREVHGIQRTYGDSPSGTLVALIGSSAWVEIAVVNGDAARTLDAGRGTTVRARRVSL